MSLILPPGYKPTTAANGTVVFHTHERYKFWHDLRFPGDIARAIVVAQRDGKRGPRQPEQCPNRDCRVCHPSQEDQDRIARGHHLD
jgi:hypothetical protein